MTALIDTSVLVADATPSIDEPWVVSVISVGELDAGVQLAEEPAVRAARLRRLSAVLSEVPVVAIDRAVDRATASYAPPPAANPPTTSGSQPPHSRTTFVS